jgi:hypothetical protein
MGFEFNLELMQQIPREIRDLGELTAEFDFFVGIFRLKNIMEN